VKYANEEYINIKHPITGQTIQAVPSGKKQSEEIEVMVISPGSNLSKIWIKRGDILEEQHPWG